MSGPDAPPNFLTHVRARCVNPMGCSTTATTCGSSWCDGRFVAMTTAERAAERARVDAFIRERCGYPPEGIELE